MSSSAPARSAPRILVVEDEMHLAQGLLFNLQAEGYEVLLAYDGEAALASLLPFDSAASSPATPQLGLAAREPTPEQPFDLVLLDVMLPGRSGFEVVTALRTAGDYTPVLMLTARSRPEDVLTGLEAGADDYLAKPFDLSILLARLRVLLRRMRWQRAASRAEELEEAEQPQTYSFAAGSIDFSLLELSAKGAVIRLTLMEADFLRYLSRHPSRIIPRKELLEQVWRVHEDTDTRAIDNFVVRLRRYIEDDPTQPAYLKTVRGVGYRFVPNGE